MWVAREFHTIFRSVLQLNLELPCLLTNLPDRDKNHKITNHRYDLVIVEFSIFQQNPEVDLNEDYVKFRALGLGVQGKNNYAFHIEFYLPVDAEVIICLVSIKY